MSTQDTRYNGWANYATWHTHLALTNSEQTQAICETMAQVAREEAHDKEQSARLIMADRLKADIEALVEEAQTRFDSAARAVGIADGGHILTGLLAAGFEAVDWTEIAAAFVDEGRQS